MEPAQKGQAQSASAALAEFLVDISLLAPKPAEVPIEARPGCTAACEQAPGHASGYQSLALLDQPRANVRSKSRTCRHAIAVPYELRSCAGRRRSWAPVRGDAFIRRRTRSSNHGSSIRGQVTATQLEPNWIDVCRISTKDKYSVLLKLIECNHDVLGQIVGLANRFGPDC